MLIGHINLNDQIHRPSMANPFIIDDDYQLTVDQIIIFSLTL